MNTIKSVKITSLLICLILTLTSCGQTPQSNASTTTLASVEVVSTEISKEVEETEKETEASVSEEPEVTEESPLVNFNPTCEQDILDLGTLLFAGTANQKYASSSWKKCLKEASPTDLLIINYACDDPEHGGWGVLGMSITNASGKYIQEDINAYTDEPEKERLLVYTVQELMDLAEITNPEDFKSFEIGAWNGGRIAGLYFLKDEIAEAYNLFIENKEAMSKLNHTYNGSLSNENATDATKAVYEYLKATYGNACITGQMESTWMGSVDYEMNYIYKRTGKYPAIRGLDFMNNDFSGVVSRSKSWWNKGGIVTICWHTGADFSSSYNESKADNINWDEAFVEGSATYKKLIAGMDRAVPYLQELDSAGVPVLWRPFHEFDGKWFWWGKGGPENFKKLWQLMYDRYTNYWGLNNLIWVLGYSNSGMELDNWYPGDEYVDIIGGDSYDNGANNDLYLKVQKTAADEMPVTFHECGQIPTESELKEENTGWLYFMTWHTEYLTDTNTADRLNEVYNSDYFITLDELPSFK